MKPKLSISFNNGVIGAVTPLDTGCFGIVASAVAVVGGFQLDTAYQVKSMKDVADLKLVDSIDNHRLFKALDEFYAEAGAGSEVWIYGISKTKKVSEWFTPVAGIAPVEHLLNSANGKIRGIFTVNDSSVAPTVTAGMDDDVLIAAGKAQTLFENYTAQKYAPYFTILEGYAFSGVKTALTDLSTLSHNAVGILIGDTEPLTGITSSKGAAVGVLAGRLAAYPAKVNAGKVINGALKAPKLFINDTPVENYDCEALYDKGYITFTTHQSRAGYFVMDDPLACDPDDDYHYLSRRRTINEAFRLCYDALLDFLLDEVPTNANGTIVATYAKTMESAVERKIYNNMASDLSRDENSINDTGVKCFVDPMQNIVTSSRIEVVVKIRPFGYNRWIDVVLGFELNS
ncbi:DUF2586 family protein [Chryseobacterium koreense]|uniref:Tail sheath protein C-terminal domain-containing protein n=1 Tax=Chryseobacterium koreense CCUG 49689 TaxID=1304281 RepID=A0A0J7IVI9_9FLAO|nr:DUF2586 family protein [Chryseobacterium koreense]KMQ70313.1 hypothetical protein ACM44_12910 [Chryseobacterium koreense CCUG 49689]MBB5334481.1 hypothetical protein [Chryseobacterium koreense]